MLTACCGRAFQRATLSGKNDSWNWAARFVLGDYRSKSSVCEMLESLEWTTIENRRWLQRLTTLHKILHNLIDIDPDCYIRPKEYRSRHGHDKQFTLFHCTSTLRCTLWRRFWFFLIPGFQATEAYSRCGWMKVRYRFSLVDLEQ